jgi:hypothetical protein
MAIARPFDFSGRTVLIAGATGGPGRFLASVAGRRIGYTPLSEADTAWKR